MPPGIQCSHDSMEFLIIDVIIALSRFKCLGEVSAWVPVPIDSMLEKYTARGMFGSVHGDGE